MRELKKELSSKKKLYECLASYKKQYEMGKGDITDGEKKKRIIQVDKIIQSYQSLKGYVDNPQAGLVNIRDMENLQRIDINEQRDDDTGEYTYTKDQDNR